MTIGVVIPCRNYETFLPECLDSVFSQQALISCVVVDDASGDPDAVFFGAARVNCSVIRLDRPRGVGIARNIGAAYLHTEYLFFLDADDTLHPGALRSLLDVLEADPLLDFVYGNYTENGVTIETLDWDRRGALDVKNIASYGALWRRDNFWAIGGYDDLPVAEDWELQRRAARLGARAHRINMPVFDHRLHDRNKWTRDSQLYGGLSGVAEWLKAQSR